MGGEGKAGGGSWSRVDRVLEAVSEVEAEEREALLDELCEGNSEVRAEVESLLAHIVPSEAMLSSMSESLGGGGGPPLSAEAESTRSDRFVGPYRLVRELRGGMSQVYEAWDEKEHRRVVVKLAREERDARARDRMDREARAAASLQHPNVCRILDTGSTPEDRPFLVLEFCDGDTLRERLKRGSLSTGLIVSMGRQVAEALSEAHGLGIVHRDIKPENIMLDDEGSVKLLDFGTAQEGSDRLTGAGMIVGTPLYMSPEQLRGEDVGSATDVWALGVVLYESLRGEHPFRGPSRRRTLMNIVHLPAPPLGDVVAVSSEELPTIIGTALSGDSKDRPSAAQFAEALGRSLSDS